MLQLEKEWADAAGMLESITSAMPLFALPEDHPAHALTRLKDACGRLAGLLQETSAAPSFPAGAKDCILQEMQQLPRLCAPLAKSWSGAAGDRFLSSLLELQQKTTALLSRITPPADTANGTFAFSLPGLSGKRIILRCGNLAASEEMYDVVICSAFKNEYFPLSHTLIGALLEEKGISVDALARRPQIDLKSMGCWLSEKLEGNFSRIGCIELLDYRNLQYEEQMGDMMLKSAFATLRFLLEQASIQGIPIRRIALPILGAGSQGIELSYLIPPLYNQFLAMFANIDTLESIDVYDLRADRIDQLSRYITKLQQTGKGAAPSVFISYNSSQNAFAHQVWQALKNAGISAWIAPESIPSGSDYTSEISRAISGVRALTLLLTPQSQASGWVRKEVVSAIGANKLILPMQLSPFPLNDSFRYLLSDVQIYPLWDQDEQAKPGLIAREIQSKL